MDLWQWVRHRLEELEKQGQGRLAQLLRLLPDAVCEEEHSRVDALIPELLAQVRSLRDPWLEIFVRHWNLQSLVLHRFDARALPEAVSLVEFSHREEHLACPQRVCTTQDLAHCYACADGAGYAEQRLELAYETLNGIDPTWACFVCISGEVAGALNDAGRYQECLDFLQEQDRQLLAHNGSRNERGRLLHYRIRALAETDRCQQALDVCDQALDDLDHKHHRVLVRLYRSWLLAGLGRSQEALEDLIPWSQIEPTVAFFEAYSLAAEALGPELIPDLDDYLVFMQQTMARQGAYRLAFDMGMRRFRLALKQQRPATGVLIVEQLEPYLEKLALPLGAPAALIQARQILAEASPQGTPQGSPIWVQLELALRSDSRLEQARALRQCQQSERAIELLQGSAELELLADLLDECGRREELLRLLAAEQPWMLIRRAALWFKEGRPDRACEDLRKVPQPELDVRLDLARAYRLCGQLESAAEILDEIVAQFPEQKGSWDWDRLVVARLLEDDDRYRHSASRLGFDLSEPIHWGMCLLQVQEEDGTSSILSCFRTGPVTGEVAELSRPGLVNHFADSYLFEASPVNLEQLKQDPDLSPIFPAVLRTLAGNYVSYFLEGLHPGQDRLTELRECCPTGLVLADRSNPNYQVAGKAGFYGWVGVSPQLGAAPAHEWLQTHCSDIWFWPDLAEAAGESDQANAMVERAGRWELWLDRLSQDARA